MNLGREKSGLHFFLKWPQVLNVRKIRVMSKKDVSRGVEGVLAFKIQL